MNLEQSQLQLQKDGFKKLPILNQDADWVIYLWIKNRLIITLGETHQLELTGMVCKVQFSGICDNTIRNNAKIKELFDYWCLGGQSGTLQDGTFTFSVHAKFGIDYCINVANSLIDNLPLITGESRVWDAVKKKTAFVKIKD